MCSVRKSSKIDGDAIYKWAYNQFDFVQIDLWYQAQLVIWIVCTNLIDIPPDIESVHIELFFLTPHDICE